MHALALRRPVSTIVGVVSLVMLGLFSLAQLPVALLPALQRPLLLIDVAAAGQAREGILLGAIIPIERRLSSLPGVSSIWSEAEEGRGRIVLEPAWQTDPDRLQLDAARLVEGAAESPLARLDVTVPGGDASAVIEIGILGGESASARTDFARKVVLPEISHMPGAGQIQSIGLAPLHVVVRPWPAALAARGIGMLQVKERLDSAGASVSAGRIRDGAHVRPLVLQEKIGSLQQLRELVIESPAGPAQLGDLAEVGLEEHPHFGAFRFDGEPGVLLRVFRAPGANAVALAAVVRRGVESLAGRSPGNMRLVIVDDRSGEILAALSGLALAAAAGILLGTGVLRMMLGRWAPTLALAVVLPASMLITFSAFKIFGIPLNVLSLAGLALAAGMLVDNSIVVLEAVESARKRTEPDAVLRGTGSVAKAVTGSCATTIVVFLPLLYIGGLAKSFFGEQAFAVASSISI